MSTQTEMPAFYVIPPHSVIDEPMKLACLELHLRHTFPDLKIVMADENVLPGNQSGVGRFTGGTDDEKADKIGAMMLNTMWDFIRQTDKPN